MHRYRDNLPQLTGQLFITNSDPVEPGTRYTKLLCILPGLTVMGGSCGTDHHHIEAICKTIKHE